HRHTSAVRWGARKASARERLPVGWRSSLERVGYRAVACVLLHERDFENALTLALYHPLSCDGAAWMMIKLTLAGGRRAIQQKERFLSLCDMLSLIQFENEAQTQPEG